MTCVYPLDAWKSRHVNQDTGKRGVTFKLSDALTDFPLTLPCGKCIGCAKDRARVWATRMYHESQEHDKNCFLTLTYENAPPELDKRHTQLFIKRLRKQYDLRYFLCGEYGEISRRPHYHAIIFGQDFLEGSQKIDNKLYTNPIVSAIWRHGLISIGEVNIQTCAYVAGYVTKKLTDTDTFNTMSRRPGIGHTWLQKFKKEIRLNGSVVIDGREIQVPKKYLEWEDSYLESVIAERASWYRTRTPEQRYQDRVSLRGKEKYIKSQNMLKTGTI